MKRETARCLQVELQQIFRERGPVDEVVIDNARSLKAHELVQLFQQLNIGTFYRAAYRPSGNSIVGRNHRTIRSFAERSAIDPEEAVFLYNIFHKMSQKEESVPQRRLYTYRWRMPMEAAEVYGRGTTDYQGRGPFVGEAKGL